MHITTAVRTAILGTLLGGALVLGATTAADAAPPTGSAQAIQTAVQQLLDTLYGPGNATVRVAAEITTTSGQVVSTTYSTPGGAPAFTQISDGSVSITGSALNSTTTSTSVPAGALVRESLAVAVNSRVKPSPNLSSLRRLVSAAAGVSVTRGDVVSIVAVPFSTAAQSAAKAAAAAARTTRSTLAFDSLLMTAIEVGGAVIAVLLLLVAVGRRGKQRRNAVAVPIAPQGALPSA